MADYNMISKVKLPDSSDYHFAPTIPYGTLDSTSTATAMTATVEGITELIDGTAVLLKNGVVTSAAGFTIDVNGLGAKPVYTNLAAATAETTKFNVNYTMLFIYDTSRVSGGCWICYNGYDANTNTVGYQLRTNSTAKPVSDTARYYKIYFTSADGDKWVPASVNSTDNATSARAVNQRPIDPFGRIVYTSASTDFTAGTNLTATSIWDQYVVTLGYSFNRTGATLTLTTGDPVYIKCSPQTDGSAIMNSTTPYTQALPSSDDGFIYIFLGVATSATQIELFINHPVYYYKDGGIKIWTGVKAPSKTSELTNDGDGTSAFATMADIGSLGGGTITSVKTTAGTHTAINVTSGAANFNVPTKTSHLTNDSGFITNAGVTSFNGSTGAVTYTAPVTSVNGSTGAVTVSVPTKTSDLTNDSGFITSSDIPTSGGMIASYGRLTGGDTRLEIVWNEGYDAASDVIVLELDTDYIDQNLSPLPQLAMWRQETSEGKITIIYAAIVPMTDLGEGGDKGIFIVELDTEGGLWQYDLHELTEHETILNGNSTLEPSFYAPTSGGTSGQYLKSNGTGNAPTWANFPTIPTLTSQLANDSNFVSDANYVHTDNNYNATAKDKVDKIVFATGMTKATFGDTPNTSDINIWGNSTNKVAISATNTQDNERYGFRVNSTGYNLHNYTTNATVWSGVPFTSTQNTKLTNIGTLVGALSGTSITDKSLSSSTSVTTLGSISFSAGYYILHVTVRFATNATGYRRVDAQQSNESSVPIVGIVNTPAVSGTYTYVHLTRIIGATSAFTVDIKAAQNSGSALTASTRYHAIRIA